MKKIILIGMLYSLSVTSAFATPSNNALEVHNYLQTLNSEDCQVTSDIVTSRHGNEHVKLSLLNLANAQSESLFLERNSTLTTSKGPSGTKLEYNDVTYQDTTLGSGLKEYQKLIVTSDLQNKITGVQFTRSKDVSGWLSVKIKVIEKFECQEE